MNTTTKQEPGATVSITPEMIADSFRANLVAQALSGNMKADIRDLVLLDIRRAVESAFRPLIYETFKRLQSDPAIIDSILQTMDSQQFPGIEKRPNSPEKLRAANPWLVSMLERALQISPSAGTNVQPDLPNLK